MHNFIVENSAICKKCGEKIVSKSVHDFVSCKCGAISVDGGMDYIRRCGNLEDIEETSIILDEAIVLECVKAVDWGMMTGRNSLGIALAVIRAIRDGGILKLD